MAFGDFIKTGRHNSGGDITTYTPDLGSNPASGNLLIFMAGNHLSYTVATPPSGFTLLTSSTAGAAAWYWYYKVSVGTEQTASLVWDTAVSGIADLTEYEWDGSTPTVDTDEDVTNINSLTNTQDSGSITPTSATNICIALHGSQATNRSFDGQAVDGSWIEDITFPDTGGRGVCKISRLVNAALSSQTAQHTDTDTGDRMYGAIAVFDVAAGGTTLALDSGSYTITGTTVDLLVGRLLTLDSGSYSITGSDLTFLRTYVLPVDSGTYSITGNDVGLLVGRILSLESGSYSITGGDVTFNLGFGLTLDSGSFSITGSDVTFLRTNILTLDSGVYSIDGQEVTFTVAIPGTDFIVGQGALILGHKDQYYSGEVA